MEDVDGVAGYYFNIKESEKRNYSRFLRSILIQLCPVKGDLPDKLKDIFDKHMSSQFSDDHVAAGLKSLQMEKERVFIIIDALDECETFFKVGEESEIEKITRLLQDLVITRGLRFHILITSRHEPGSYMQKETDKALQMCRDHGIYGKAIDLQRHEMAIKLNDDVRTFISSELFR